MGGAIKEVGILNSESDLIPVLSDPNRDGLGEFWEFPRGSSSNVKPRSQWKVPRSGPLHCWTYQLLSPVSPELLLVLHDIFRWLLVESAWNPNFQDDETTQKVSNSYRSMATLGDYSVNLLKIIEKKPFQSLDMSFARGLQHQRTLSSNKSQLPFQLRPQLRSVAAIR